MLIQAKQINMPSSKHTRLLIPEKHPYRNYYTQGTSCMESLHYAYYVKGDNFCGLNMEVSLLGKFCHFHQRQAKCPDYKGGLD